MSFPSVQHEKPDGPAIRLRVFDAGRGDCLLLKFRGESGNNRNILVDTGTSRSKELLSRLERQITEAGERIDLVVITHVDNDHLGGLLALEKHGAPLCAELFLMNYAEAAAPWAVEGETPLSLRENHALSRMLSSRGAVLRGAVRGDTLCLDGAKLYIVSPTQERLRDLFLAAGQDTLLGGGSDWDTDLETLMDAPLPARDASVNNGASIVFVFEYLGVRILFTGDGIPEDILEGLQACGLPRAEDGRIRFDAVKLPHHGSARNISEQAPGVVDAHRFILCADGSRHPDKLTIAKLLQWHDTVEIVSGRSWWDRGFVTEADRTRFLETGRLRFYTAERGAELAW